MHDGDGVGEAFEIFGEAALVGALVEPLPERLGISGGEFGVACVLGQFDHRLRAEHAIEMFVQQDFGEGFQELLFKLHETFLG